MEQCVSKLMKHNRNCARFVWFLLYTELFGYICLLVFMHDKNHESFVWKGIFIRFILLLFFSFRKHKYEMIVSTSKQSFLIHQLTHMYVCVCVCIYVHATIELIK